jgi:carbonic anhydrase
MSIFDSAHDWPDKYKSCGAPHQSPINLSQSFALPCDRLCEWKVDEVSVGQADLYRSEAGMLLSGFKNGTPTATFNGDGYTCREIELFSSAQHSLDSVFGEAELVAKFDHPSGKTVHMSVIVRTSPGDTPSAKFFNAFVPYFVSGGGTPQVNLGNSWSLTDIVPDTPAYYMYTGSSLTPPCFPNITWIVYSNTVTMDPSDYATLAKYIKPSRRPLEEVADREVTFYDAQGVTTQRDGKLYLKCRRPGGVVKKEKEPMIQKGGLQDEVDKQADESTTQKRNNFRQAATDQYMAMGGIWGILEVLTLITIAGLLFFTEAGKKIGGLYFTIVFFMPNLIRSIIVWLIWGRKKVAAVPV